MFTSAWFFNALWILVLAGILQQPALAAVGILLLLTAGHHLAVEPLLPDQRLLRAGVQRAAGLSRRARGADRAPGQPQDPAAGLAGDRGRVPGPPAHAQGQGGAVGESAGGQPFPCGLAALVRAHQLALRVPGGGARILPLWAGERAVGRPLRLLRDRREAARRWTT